MAEWDLLQKGHTIAEDDLWGALKKRIFGDQMGKGQMNTRWVWKLHKRGRLQDAVAIEFKTWLEHPEQWPEELLDAEAAGETPRVIPMSEGVRAAESIAAAMEEGSDVFIETNKTKSVARQKLRGHLFSFMGFVASRVKEDEMFDNKRGGTTGFLSSGEVSW